MSKYHVGDTFKIEIAEVFQGVESRKDKYRIKGFDNLIFDDKGLDRLAPVIRETEHRFKMGDVVYFEGEFFITLYESGDHGFITAIDKNKDISQLCKSDVMYEASISIELLQLFLDGKEAWERIEQEVLPF